MAKIKVYNFGAISDGYLENDGYIEFPKVTIFIGDQGTGKSTIAKLYSMFSWIEKSIYKGELSDKDISKEYLIKKCRYHRIHNYFKDSTILEYKGEFCDLSYKDGVFEYNPHPQYTYITPKIMYVPAERNFLSVVNNPQKLSQIPAPLSTFLDEFVNAEEDLTTRISLPLPNIKYEYNKLNSFSYIFIGEKKLGLPEASSGIQSLTPLYLVSNYLTKTISERTDENTTKPSLGERKKIDTKVEEIISNPDYSAEVKDALLKRVSAISKNDRFMNIVEEMEQNLYPSSQRLLLNKLLEFANKKRDNSLVLTTHSPYIINYISLAIKAKDLLNKNEAYMPQIAEIVPIETIIDGSDVVVYELADGKIHKLSTYDNMPSDTNMLNSAIEEINELFDSLLDIQESISNEH